MRYMNPDAGRTCLLELNGILGWLGVPYFLMQGTALGAVRDNGFVPTEKDIDLGLPYEHFRTCWPGLVRQLSKAGFDLEILAAPFGRPRTLVAWKYYGPHCVKADLVGWVLWTCKDGRRVRFTQVPRRPWTEPPVADSYAIVHDAALLDTYRTVALFGREFRVPENTEEYLRREYGDDWRTPRENHVSRTRVYGFLEQGEVPLDLLG